jgi:poly-beta-hydroxyalkanoate depolymerase
MDAVSSQDKEYVELRGGHSSVFSGRQAHKVMWPKLDEWLTQRVHNPSSTAFVKSQV